MDEGTVTTQPSAQSYIIKRPRLTKLLDESGARIILLLAPAGYGKTTLAREWLALRRAPVAWYPCSPSSADVAALALGLAAALDAVAAGGERSAEEHIARLTSVQQKPEVLARGLAKTCAGRSPQLVIAVDDYHHVAESPDAEEFVGALASLLPATFLIASRTRPRWLTSRLAVYGEALEVGIHDLSMSDEEAQAILDRSAGKKSIAAIMGTARGWPVVLGLAARSDKADLPTQALPWRLYEFLAEDLLQASAPETQEALTILAACGVRDRALAERLLGSAAQVALGEAETRGLVEFEGAQRIVLHPLLAEFLMTRVRDDAGRAPAFLGPSMHLLLDQGRWDECLTLAEHFSAERAFVTDAIRRCLDDLLATGRVATVRRWVALAREANISDSIVDLAEAEVLLRSGDYGSAIALATRAAPKLQPHGLECRAQLVAARAAHLADDRQQASALFRSAERTASTPQARAEALWGQLLIEHEEESDELEQAFERFAAVNDGSVEQALRTLLGRLLVAISKADLRAGADATDAAQHLVPLASDPMVRLSALVQHSWAYGWVARYEAALGAAVAVTHGAEESGIDFAVQHGLVVEARALIGLRRFAEARRALVRLRGLLKQESDSWVEMNTAIQEARLQISLGDLEKAADHLSLPPEQGLNAFTIAEHHAYRGLVDAARGRAGDARNWIARSLERSTHVDAHGIVCVAEAILECQGKARRDELIADWVEVVLRSGHLDAVMIGCRAHAGLAMWMAGDTRYRETLSVILTASCDEPLARAIGLQIPRVARRTKALSPRELEVYELMTQGRTNQEIARSLYITESTTKVHVRHILEKLGVRSRVEAVGALEAGAAARQPD